MNGSNAKPPDAGENQDHNTGEIRKAKKLRI
jgi:hypothetical protein